MVGLSREKSWCSFLKVEALYFCQLEQNSLAHDCVKLYTTIRKMCIHYELESWKQQIKMRNYVSENFDPKRKYVIETWIDFFKSCQTFLFGKNFPRWRCPSLSSRSRGEGRLFTPVWGLWSGRVSERVQPGDVIRQHMHSSLILNPELGPCPKKINLRAQFRTHLSTFMLKITI